MSELHERIFTCTDCNENFAWTVGEQLFLQEKVKEGKMKAVYEPQRCKRCRKKRNAEKAQAAAA